MYRASAAEADRCEDEVEESGYEAPELGGEAWARVRDHGSKVTSSDREAEVIGSSPKVSDKASYLN